MRFEFASVDDELLDAAAKCCVFVILYSVATLNAPPSPSGRAAAAASTRPHHSCGPCSPAAAAPSCPGPSHTRHGPSRVAVTQSAVLTLPPLSSGWCTWCGADAGPAATTLRRHTRGPFAAAAVAVRCSFHVAWVSGLAARRAVACFRKHCAGDAAISAKSLQWQYHDFDVRYHVAVGGIAVVCLQPRCAHVLVLQLRGLHYDRIRVPQARATATSVS